MGHKSSFTSLENPVLNVLVGMDDHFLFGHNFKIFLENYTYFFENNLDMLLAH